MSENKFELIIENGIVTGCKGKSKVIEIPEGVTEIGEGAFQNCQFIEEVYSKSSVLKTIGDFAFENCKNLKVCNLKALKGSIESNAFSCCESLKSFDIPNGTIKIGSYAFEYCDSLIYVIIPSSVFVLDGYIFDVDNKKTVILGELGSEAEEYANKQMIPFKENTKANRDEFLRLENKKDNTGYQDFNVFGETVRCYKSITIYQELLDFYRNLTSDFSHDIFSRIPMDFTKIESNVQDLPFLSQRYIEKTNKFLQKHGVFISDSIFKGKTVEYNENYKMVGQTFIDSVGEILIAAQSDTDALKSSLIAEAESKVTGLSYGVIGDSLTLAAYAFDEYREEKRQRKQAYAVASSKMQEGTDAILNQVQSVYSSLLNETMLPAFDKSITYVCDGLMQLVIEEMIEAKVIAKEVFNIYDISKSKKLIEQATKNTNIDKKYAIAMALKLYPLNIDAIAYAIRNNLIEEELLNLIEYLEFYKNDIVVLSFEDSFTYLELISLVEKYNNIPCDNLKISLNNCINRKAKLLINKINDYYDPMQIDIDTWNDLVKKYQIVRPEKLKIYNITEEVVKGPNGRELLSEAIAYARAEKKVADAKKRKQELERKAAEKERKEKERQEREEKERLAREQEEQEQANKKKKRKIIAISIPSVIALVTVTVLLLVTVVIPNNKYNEALALKEQGKYNEAIIVFTEISNKKDSTTQIQECYYLMGQRELENKNYAVAITHYTNAGSHKDSVAQAQECYYLLAEEFILKNNLGAAAINFAKAGDYKDAAIKSKELWDKVAVRETISAGLFHTLALKNNNTVLMAGGSSDSGYDKIDWTDIVAVAASDGYSDLSIGLKTDGHVVALGSNIHGACNVDNWSNMVAISVGWNHTVGLKSDGTVVAVGKNDDGQCDVGGWTDVVAISAGLSYTVGLKSDGTVVAVGFNRNGECNVSGWTDIVAISAGSYATYGLRSDGTVVTTDKGDDVSKWTDIVAISAGLSYTVGLKSDGTVVAVGENDNGQCGVGAWTDIVAISAGCLHTIGLKSDGTVIAVGHNGPGRCDIKSWKSIKVPSK